MNTQHRQYRICAAVCSALLLVLVLVPAAASASQEFFTLQMGSHANEAEAREHFGQLREALSEEQNDFLRIERVGKFYTVRLGRIDNRPEADKLLSAVHRVDAGAILLKAYIKEERISEAYRAALSAPASGGGEQRKRPAEAPASDLSPDSSTRKKETVRIEKQPPALRRDLFASVYTPRSLQTGPEEISKGTLQLKATIIDGAAPLAIIGTEVLGVGDAVGDYRVTAIQSSSVKLSGRGRQYILRMYGEKQ